MVKKPNFFIAGAPKSGTTSLYEYLGKHPEVYLSPRKEPQFFGSDFTRKPINVYQHIQDENTYLSLFAGVTTEIRIGEGSTSYLYSRNAAAEIKKFSPSSKIIMMLRSPIEMMNSMYHEQRFHGYEPLATFEDALVAEQDRKAGKRIPDTVYILESLFYREIAQYTVHLQRFFDAFGRENVQVILFDEFVRNTREIYQQTLQFLEVDPHFETEFPIRNMSKMPRSRWLRDFLHDPPPTILRTGQAVLPIARPIYHRLRHWNVKKSAKEPIHKKLYDELRIEFRPQIEKLEVLLGWDLQQWY